MIYCYYVSLKLASLHKMFANGNDVDSKPVKIGRFASDAEAKQACLKHYEKACKLAVNLGREVPQIRFV